VRKAEVLIGGIYAAKVSSAVVPVKILRSSPSGGWVGRNLVTGRSVRIKTAARLRFEMVEQVVDGRRFLARKGSKVFSIPEKKDGA
jgi:hypothetical protein